MRIEEANKLLLQFKETNPVAKITGFGPGALGEVPIAKDGLWLEVKTSNLGWLHVYINKETNQLEWF